MAYVKLASPPAIGQTVPNTGEFTTVGVGAAAVTAGLYVNVTNRIGTWITGTNISTGADADGMFVDVSFNPSSNVTNAASIGLYPTFAPPGGVTITNAYGLYIASGTQGGAGTVTTGYGLYVTSPTFGSANKTANIGGLVVDSGGTGTISAGVWNGTVITVAYGGTGASSFTAYAPICGGTTSTNPLQSASTGLATSGFVLTSNGNAALPSFQAVSASGAITTITGNSGGAESPSAGNFNILGTGSITVAGSANTETVQLTGLTSHNVLIGAGTATITKVAPSATSGVPLISQGAAADPTFGTAVVAGGGTGSTSFNTTGVVISGATSTTALTAVTLADGQLAIGSSSGNPAAANLSAGTGISISNAANSITISASGSGLTWSDNSGSFTATASHGYFITAASTPTLPASPSEGDTVVFIVDTASACTITGNTGQKIRVGTTLSAAAGTCASNNQGDSITLTYRSTGTTWFANCTMGTWTVT